VRGLEIAGPYYIAWKAIIAVRNYNHGLASMTCGLKCVQTNRHGAIQGGIACGLHLLEGLRHAVAASGPRLNVERAIVETEHSDFVVRPQSVYELKDGLSCKVKPASPHALARVDCDKQAERYRIACELSDLLRLAILHDRERVQGQSADGPAVFVDYGDVEGDQVSLGSETGLLSGRSERQTHQRENAKPPPQLDA